MSLPLKKKLIVTFVATALLPLVGLGIFSYYQSNSVINAEAQDRLNTVKNIKGSEVVSYFDTTKKQMITFSDSLHIQEAMVSFSQSFSNFSSENEYVEADQKKLDKSLNNFYSDEFVVKFNKENKEKISASSLINDLSSNAKALQYNYISNNKNPLGEKDTLDSSNDKSSYSKIHKKYHPTIRKFLKEFGYYDIFLVDINTGDVVYSVFKELDYATSLLTGPYKDTNFAQAYRQARNLPKVDDFVLVDYQTYKPSYNAPASFIASPIWYNGKKIGVAVFQMPIDRLNSIMNDRSGMGSTGESYLIGSDHLLRSDSYLDKKKYNVVDVFKNAESRKIKSEAIEAAVVGNSGFLKEQNYLKSDVFTSYKSLDILGLKWGLIVQISTEEALRALSSLEMAIFLCLLICCLLTFFVALSLSNSISNKISTIATNLLDSSKLVGDSSMEINSSSSLLSEAATEQASSIQETFSTIDEISGMINNNARSAKNSVDVSFKSKETVEKGKNTVNNMIKSIEDISNSNDEIMIEMKSNNREISNIINVISNIGEKTKVINDIVFQTKLLSFNASVEAARAGEHGKGFAVVAEEVGNLASMSGKAAEEITLMLENSISQVSEIVEKTRVIVEGLVAKSKQKVDYGTKTAGECAEALDEILKNVDATNNLVSEIATASEEQATGVRQVTQAMQQLDSSTTQNTEVAKRSSCMANQLKNQAGSLNKAVKDLFLLVNGQGNTTELAQVVSFDEKKKSYDDSDFIDAA